MSARFFDKENFKINSSAWAIQDASGVVNGQKISIKIKINPEWDVREYLSGIPAAFIGQQFFTFAAALRETKKAGKSLPADQQALHEVIVTMSWDTELQKYKNYFAATNVQLAGCYSSGLHVFDDIWIRWYYRLDDWTRLNLNATTRGVARRDETMGYSVRVV